MMACVLWVSTTIGLEIDLINGSRNKGEGGGFG